MNTARAIRMARLLTRLPTGPATRFRDEKGPVTALTPMASFHLSPTILLTGKVS